MPKFKLLTGDHAVTRKFHDKNGRLIEERTVLAQAGAVVDTEDDLCALFNRQGVRPKFELIHDGAPVSGHVWNPEVETLEAFALRMRGVGQPQEAVMPMPPSRPYTPQGEGAPAPGQLVQPDVGGSTTAQASRLTSQQLQVMSVDQLRAHCEAEEIPFDQSDPKDKLVTIIRAFQGGN